MEKMGIPYAVTFGEKDSTTYATHSREKLRKYLMKQNKNSTAVKVIAAILAFAMIFTFISIIVLIVAGI